ncbi:SAM-dependent methyltransferase [Neorhizobium sp. SOG26]|uniref:class I SAM-dependent methyltransferase n=1 Tax=Neorhizobium sp. SOG26 TaxID=2060726 RepID=UPI000E59187A|nr:class I SAM-dependent methyltransferase [Neorhizobium sp. SOG26]AXV16186.1 SAM-dependent methyltransferase [Neorhizobium sp. SOG26]
MNKNEDARAQWVGKQLRALQAGSSILDVGAGECQYKPFCDHLRYVAQDVAVYDGKGDQSGLQTGNWDFSQIDIRCDLLDIPEDVSYDAVLCTEVLEHVPDPVAALEKLVRLTADGGTLIITAPFWSMTHFAPYHYATGFSRFFYRHHLERLGCEIVLLEANGGYFDFLEQELGRTAHTYRKYTKTKLSFVKREILKLATKIARAAAADDGEALNRRSSELMTLGWHVVARKLPAR